ncbi:hypothetical protein WA026_022417 [Henosepilachna vigintioctopunctata]|uniref:Peptidase S1 domain-containing protein n=1 Tax=Henosepilachna vigintioctopunctata TaxID=420089 RepID=A0AAW1UC49_9CUCU
MFFKLTVLVCLVVFKNDVFGHPSSVSGVEPTLELKPPDVSSHANLQLLPKDCGRIRKNLISSDEKKVSLFEFPWMALAAHKYPNGNKFLCGGVVISDRYILTVAHCFTDLDQESHPVESVRVGEYDLSSTIDCETDADNKKICAPPALDVKVERIILHPHYKKGKFGDDIALIRLASKINFTDTLAAICLPVTQETSSYDFSGKKVLVTAFRLTEKGKNATTPVKENIKYIDRSECNKIYDKMIHISHLQMCAGGTDMIETCGGDSGNALQVVASVNGEQRYVQHGITSLGPRTCGKHGRPAVYTRVSYYMDWILDNMSP